MNIQAATRSFERWLFQQTTVVKADLHHKHLAMGESPFGFLRATYYRWAQQVGGLDAVIATAPVVLAVGDLHLENFGTWRDEIGRLAWGINDFDEAFPLPYTLDLVRLATSAMLAIEDQHLRIKPKDACRAIVEGYRQGIAVRGRPFVIGEEHRWFKPILQNPLRDPGLFWDKLRGLPPADSSLPQQAKALLRTMMPDPKLKYDLHHRMAGLGNLGKPRYTAIANWQGGPVAREVKALTLSATAWAKSSDDGPFYADILSRAIRSCDPCLKVRGSWIARRLSPDCRRLEVGLLGRVKDEQYLLHAMGFETANVHLGTRGAGRKIEKHLEKLPKNAIRKAAASMMTLLEKDYRDWRRG